MVIVGYLWYVPAVTQRVWQAGYANLMDDQGLFKEHEGDDKGHEGDAKKGQGCSKDGQRLFHSATVLLP